MSDRQARDRILKLLHDQPNRGAGVALRRMAQSLQTRQVSDSPYGPFPETPDDVTNSIRALRKHYNHLHDEIQGVPTNSDGKRTALRALRAFDSALKHFYQGLVSVGPQFALDELREAKAYAEDANTGLHRARRQLR